MTNLDEIKKQFSSLNDMQQKAVFQTEGPVLILAGAGSGKTTVLVNRIAYIIKAELAEPWQILAITFTNKAAGELKERIETVCGEGSDEVWAATFHSTCARILRRWGDRLGFSSHFTIYDTDDSRRLMKEILKQLDIDEKFLPHKAVLNEISKYKDKMKEPKDIQNAASYDSRLKFIAQAYELYQQRLLTSDAMDFDDLICNTIKLFEQNQDVLEFYQRRFKYILVDEYQDTNKSQYRLISLLSQARSNLCVVGDDDQSIYRFRGATIENILSFENEFKGAVVIRLEQNYRSTGNILDAANNVIKNNDERKGKTLWTENPKGELITVHTAASEREEALFIAQTIFDGVAKGRSYSDYAILYRMNAQSNAIEQALSRSGIPHRVIGGHRFYDREEIKDMTSYLQVVNNPHDDIRLRRIINKPKRAIGEATMTKVAEIAAGIGESVFSVIRHASDYPTLARAASKLESFAKLIEGFVEAAESGDYSIAELYNLILEHTDYKNYLIAEKDDYEQRIENIDELSSNIIKFQEDYGDDATLGAFLEEISLMTDIDNYDAEADCTVMMTLHSAKGLEFPVVFIPGMEDGVFPSMATIMEAGELNEERRLAYVGITRAKEKLYLIKTRERMLFGSTTHNRESRFITEIPSSLIERTGSDNIFSSGRRTERRPMQQNFDPFAKRKPSAPKTAPATNVYHIGDVVLHNAFGKGMIISTTAMGNDTLLEIAFDSVGTKKVMANFAKIEIIK